MMIFRDIFRAHRLRWLRIQLIAPGLGDMPLLFYEDDRIMQTFRALGARSPARLSHDEQPCLQMMLLAKAYCSPIRFMRVSGAESKIWPGAREKT